MTNRRDRPASDAELNRIALTTAQWFGVDAKPWYGSGARGVQSARARQVAMYLMRDLTEASLERIGKILHRHHSTIMFGVGATVMEMGNNPTFDRCVRTLKQLIVDGDKSTRPQLIELAYPVDKEQKERATETA